MPVLDINTLKDEIRQKRINELANLTRIYSQNRAFNLPDRDRFAILANIEQEKTPGALDEEVRKVLAQDPRLSLIDPLTQFNLSGQADVQQLFKTVGAGGPQASQALTALQNRIAIAQQQQTEQQQREAARQRVLAQIPQLQQQLGASLLDQQQQAFTRLQPQIEQRLNTLGLLQSGALPEAFARVQRDLESQRQARLADFGIQAQSRAQLDLPYQDVLSQLEIGRAGLQRQFGLQDVGNEEAFQQQLQSQALAFARAQQQEQIRNQKDLAITQGLFGLGGSLLGAGGNVVGGGLAGGFL